MVAPWLQSVTMARVRAPVPTPVNFHARITAGEGRAVEVMIQRHGAELAKLGAGSGGNAAAWFRAMVRRMAAEQGVAIVEDEVVPPAEAPPVKEAPRPKAKRARSDP